MRGGELIAHSAVEFGRDRFVSTRPEEPGGRQWSRSPAGIGLALLLGLVLLGPALAQISAGESPTIALARELIGAPAGRPLSGAELDRVTHDVASLMRCPVCQGLSVADSPTASAVAMREEARELLSAGFSDDQTLAYFERSYGEFIRLSPKPEGFNLVVWLLPVAALFVGALIIGLRVRNRRGPKTKADRAEDSAEAVVEDLAEYVERVRREAAD